MGESLMPGAASCSETRTSFPFPKGYRLLRRFGVTFLPKWLSIKGNMGNMYTNDQSCPGDAKKPDCLSLSEAWNLGARGCLDLRLPCRTGKYACDGS